MQLSNASALLPPHCVAIAPLLKDARDGLDESGSLKFLQLLSSLCLLPAFVAQAQCSAAGFPTQANTCDVFLLCDPRCSALAPAASAQRQEPSHQPNCRRHCCDGRAKCHQLRLVIRRHRSCTVPHRSRAPVPAPWASLADAARRRLHSSHRQPSTAARTTRPRPLCAKSPRCCRFPSGWLCGTCQRRWRWSCLMQRCSASPV